MIKDYFRIAINNLSHRKLRTFLTLIGIFIGIAAVVGLISLAQGFNNYLQDEFSALGADKIIISPAGSNFGSSDMVSNPLMLSDVDVVESASGVREASYFVMNIARVEWGKNDLDFQAVVTYPLDHRKELAEETFTLEAVQGRSLKQGDKYSAFIGHDYANFVGYDKNLRVGDKMFINGKEFKIVGINRKIGNPNDDKMILIPEAAFKELFDKGDEVSQMVARVNKGAEPSDVVKNIEKDLRRHRGVKEGEEDFEVTTFEELIQTFLTIFSVVGVVLVGIASISLFVGGIGIMNTMYTAVIERTKEIGIMKAIGARNEDILKMFLIESGFLGLIGGVIGVGIGLGIAKAVEFIGTVYLGSELLKAAVPWWLIVGALAFAFILGSISGILPARQASNMSPVDALRTE